VRVLKRRKQEEFKRGEGDEGDRQDMRGKKGNL
jgi:hypothetical protein